MSFLITITISRSLMPFFAKLTNFLNCFSLPIYEMFILGMRNNHWTYFLGNTLIDLLWMSNWYKLIIKSSCYDKIELEIE